MVVRYAAEMSSLEEGIAQANAAVESLTPVAAEMAASVDASFATIDNASGAVVASFTSLGEATTYLDDQMALYASTSVEATVSTDALSTSLSAAAMEANKVAISQERLNAAMLQSDSAMARFEAAQNRAAISAQALSKAQIQTQLAQLKLTAATEAAASEEGIWADVTAGMGTIGEAAATGIGFVANALMAVVSAAAIVVAVLGVVGIAIAGVSAKLAGDFQAGLTSLVTGAGEAQKNIQMVGDGILALAPKVGQTTGSLIAGMYQIESAGFHGAKGLEVLTAASEGAKVGGAQLADVANGVTTAMTDYAATGLTAAQATNTLIAAVSEGKTHVADLSTAFSTILPTSAAAGVSFRDTAGALATMTGEGTDAASAATYLRQTILSLEAPSKAASTTLHSIGLTTQQVASEMKVSLPGAMQLITDAIGKKFPEGSAAYIDALKNIFGGTKQLQGALELTGTHLKTFQDNVNGIADSVKKGGNAITGWANVQGDFNTKMAQAGAALEVVGIKIGTLLLPVLSSIMDKINPIITAFGNWVTSSRGLAGILGQLGDAFNQIFNPVQKLAPILSPVNDAFDRTKTALAGMSPLIQPIADAFDRTKTALAAVAPLVPPISDAFDRTKTGLAGIPDAVHKASNPFTQFFQIVKNVVDFMSHIDWGTVWKTLVTDFNNVKTAVTNIWNVISKVDWGGIWNALVTAVKNVHDTFVKLQPVFQQIGSFVVSTFLPIWKQLQNSWRDIVAAITPIMPQIKMLGEALGVVLVIVLALAVGIITGLARALAGVVQIITGIIQFFSGFVQVMSGLSQLLVDLFTGNFGKLGTDIDNIMQGLVTMFLGTWNIIAGIFNTFMGLVTGIVDGFCAVIKGIFQGLSAALVGHSIIPDMINAIISWFAQLPGRAIGAVQGLAGQLAGFFSGLASQAVSWGANIIQGVINGITSMFGNVSNAMSNLAGLIGSWLPRSPAKQGELSHLNEYGPALVKGISQGIAASQPLLQASLDLLMRPVGQAMHVAPASSTAPVAGSGNAQGKREIHVHVHIGAHEIGHYIADDVGEVVVDRLRSHGLGRVA